MTDEEETYLYQMQGRILACEEMQRRLINLMALILNPSDPASQIAAIERGTMASLQNIEREIGENEDLIWDSMVASLRRQFTNARAAAAEGFEKRDTP